MTRKIICLVLVGTCLVELALLNRWSTMTSDTVATRYHARQRTQSFYQGKARPIRHGSGRHAR
jgi:hypothetical protein